MEKPDISRVRYLASIASLYYKENMSQKEIADKIGVSRTEVSRLLSESREKGIVNITINYLWDTAHELEEKLIKTFKLRDAIVLESDEISDDEMVIGLGELASDYLERLLCDNMSIGISWGLPFYAMIKSLHHHSFSGIEVVQLIGAATGLGHDPLLAQTLANCLGGFCRYMNAPAIVETRDIRDSIIKDKSIHETLQYAEKCDIALMGIGTTDPKYNSMVRAGYLSISDLKEYQKKGLVGDICLYFYDKNGEILDIDLNHRRIGIDLSVLSRIPIRIGVAGGDQKVTSILAALIKRYVNVIITDSKAAQAMLNSCKSCE